MECSLKNLSESVKPMIDNGIENAKFHGINLHPGVPNLANGDCALECMIDSISTRQCFKDIFEGTPQFWRNKWLTEAEDVAFEFDDGGMSKVEWQAAWAILKKSGQYEYVLGDLILPVIAHCTKKDVLIFNTSPRAHSPIFVVQASTIGQRAADTQIPVVLAYDQSHYESLVPDTPEDIQKTIKLKERFINGEYRIGIGDIPVLRDQVDHSAIIEDSSSKSSKPWSKEEKWNTAKPHTETKTKGRSDLPGIGRTDKANNIKSSKVCNSLTETGKRGTKKTTGVGKSNQLRNCKSNYDLNCQNRFSCLSNLDSQTSNNTLQKLEELKKIKKKDRTEVQRRELEKLIKDQQREKDRQRKGVKRNTKPAQEKKTDNERDRKRKADKMKTQSAEEIEQSKVKAKERKAAKVENQSTEEKKHAKEKDKLRKAEVKKAKTAENKKKENEKDRKRKADKLKTQSAEVIVKAKLKVKEKKAEKLKNQSIEDTKKDIEKDRIRKTTQRAQKKTSVEHKEALRCEEIVEGKYFVSDLKDTNDSIGEMNFACKFCNALKFRKETASTCCNNGKVVLENFPIPPLDIDNLWREDTPEGRVFRENARSINNAVCLTSIKVKHRNFGKEFNPSVVFLGRVQKFAGPLQAAIGEKPCFAQLYVNDPLLESGLRYQNMTIPPNMSKAQKEILKNVLDTVQKVLHDSNPFIQDFKQIMEIPMEELERGKIVISAKARPKGEHERRYNEQTNLQEVSILTNSEPHDLVLQLRGGGLQTISDLNPKSMPLHFTLLFPHGTYGWDLCEMHTDGKRRVTTREFYVYHINERDIDQDYIHSARRLFQEWLCMAWVAVEDQKLNFQRKNQKALRADTYKNIKEATETLKQDLGPRVDGMFPDDHKIPTVGRKILSSSFSGSPRWYNAKFQDGMAICREYRKPDFFITMTCNPNWPEIQTQLKNGQKAQDRPDIVARVFKLKKDQLMQDLKTGGAIGKVVAHMHVVEFQKRGLPHAHILIILADRDRSMTAEMVDSMVSAELPPSPDDTDDPVEAAERKRLYDIVLTNMVHGPCGEANPGSPCMDNGKCTKKYPKEFQQHTSVDPDNNYATYRRRAPKDGGNQAVCKKTKSVIDNRMIVPYCPFLSLRYNCHINFEFCTSPKAAKYLYKYVTKGSDRAMVATVLDGQPCQPRDEVTEYEDLRSVGSSEATWHLMCFPITERYPPVHALRVHTEDQHQIVFDEGTEEEALEKQRETELTAFFELNKQLTLTQDTTVDSLPTYVELPKKFRYDKSKKQWVSRKAHSEDTVIGRVHTVNPLAGETFYLRILLHNEHCKGKTGFTHLKLLNNGRSCETYQEVCRELGLLRDDMEWQRVLEESAVTKLCPQIRELFIVILIFCHPANPKMLFDEFWETWTDDFEQMAIKKKVILDKNQLQTMLLLDLEMQLQSFEKSLADFGLKEPTEDDLANVETVTNTEPVVIREEKDYNVPQLIEGVKDVTSMFTEEQSHIFDTVINAVKQHQSFWAFIDARGGCGKTFLLNAILAGVRSLEQEGCVALAMATTGIAANLLNLGRTFHSRLKAPLTPTEDSLLQISAQSNLAKLVKMSRLLLIDESTMLDRFLLEALDRSLRDLMGQPDQPFGGKVLLLAGDFRQCLPVVPGANRAGTINHSINKSPLWEKFQVLRLTENMRVRASGDPVLESFDKWTLSIGNGITGSVPIPEEMVTEIVPNTKFETKNEERSMKKFCEEVFPDIKNNINKAGWLDGRTILAPTNKEVDAVNDMIQDWLSEAGIKLSSADTVENPEDAFRFNTEYLNTLRPNGFPQHTLNLKPGMPLMLLRNINPRQGLCNGTRLVFEKCIDNKLLQCSIVQSGRVVLIPRITFIPKVNEYPFEWQRRQFPVRPAFAITINKSQGQTLKHAGVWLRGQVFTHGQLYVACSRVSSPCDLKFALMRESDEQQCTADNIVYKEVLINLN